eukprot:6250156-Prymnesium_polylepis.2
MLGLTNVPVFTFGALRRPPPRRPAWLPVTAKPNLRAGGVLRDRDAFIVVSLAALAHRRIPDHAKPTSTRVLA